uniref:ATP synthase subunit a n=1 Tax=Bokermannohyla alvarengai TaxID=1513809 RepID=A0A343RF63_BOKAL|nr:ATP synthase F0 subunit 6 [Bokermannohyla alvarengai]ATY40980.1 ATP synthase F0 subunit 6 [Bokermannohyla alvarengai]
MILSLFDQFASPSFMGIPLILIALVTPWVILLTPCTRWTTNRFTSLQAWLVKSFSKQIFSPLNTPGHTWALILTSLFIFLLFTNLLGLLPYTFTPTTQLSLNLGLAIPLWLATVAVGFRNQPTASLGHLLPEGTPTLLIPILIIIETISLFIRPMALGVRLTANLTAGHLLIQLISSATMAMLLLAPAVSILTFITLVTLTVLEIAVAMIQAYVFVLLLSLYLQENT